MSPVKATFIVVCSAPEHHPRPAGPGALVEAVDGPAEANAWFARERPNLVAAVADAAAHGLDTDSWQLPWVLTAHLYCYGHWEDLTTVQKTAGEAAASAGDTTAQALLRR